MNDKNFEDRERMLGKVLSLFYETLYLWTTVLLSTLLVSYSDFFVDFSLSI